ncbi:MAG: cytochrome [Phycisphaeraceae bacterium]|nr:cytochrome [Phycisphaeraceae bacterium]
MTRTIAVRPDARDDGRPVFNPLTPEYRMNPHPLLHRLRREDPVHHNPILDVWVLTRYDDVLDAMHDERFSASAQHWTHYERYFRGRLDDASSALARIYGRWMLQVDPPDHTRLRSAVSRSFTPKIVEQLRGAIERTVAALLDAVADRGAMDFVEDFAYPLPIIVICELLGVPEEDRARIRAWSARLLPSFSPALSRRGAEDADDAVLALEDYFRDLMRRRDGGARGSDLVRALVDAGESARLDPQELLSTCVLLVFAGHLSTVQAIANTLVALLEHPTQLAAVRDQPDLVAAAVEESLRYEAPLQLVYRTTREPVSVRGVPIDANRMVFLSLVAANRDPEHFPDPDTFDISRDNRHHLAFGHGIHFCAGAALARLEARIAIDAVLRRFDVLHLDRSGLEREPSLILRGLTRVPVRWT